MELLFWNLIPLIVTTFDLMMVIADGDPENDGTVS